MMFKSILNRIRTDGKILKPHANVLLHHTSETDGAIELYALRKDVDRVNSMNIANLPSLARNYKCMDHFRWADNHKDDRTMERNNFRMPDGTLAALVSCCLQLRIGPSNTQYRKNIVSKRMSN
jgi:hypothetical protein